jgi:hypothetical protein
MIRLAPRRVQKRALEVSEAYPGSVVVLVPTGTVLLVMPDGTRHDERGINALNRELEIMREQQSPLDAVLRH